MYKPICLALLGLGSIMAASAQTEVAPYTPGVTPNGITYFLPRTGFHLTITARRTSYQPGEYAAYAERYLRQKGVVQKTYDEWELTGLTITDYGEADPSKAYTIALNPKSAAPLVSLAPDGRLLAVNTDQAPAIATLSTPSVTPDPVKQVRGADYKTEEILSAGSKAKMAELTAAEIYDIRENRSLLTKGQADFMPKDGEQLRLMLANLDTQEKALLELFTGTKTSERHTFVFDICPEQAAGQTTLFAFSKYLGMVDVDDPAGTPFVLNIQKLPSVKPVYVDNSGKQKKEVLDLRYVVPANVELSVTSGDEVWAKQVVPMAQFGQIEHLGGELFNKKFTTHVQLSPVTGGIVNIEAERPE